MKMPNMGNSFIYFRQSSVPVVNSFKMVGVNCGLIPNRPSELVRTNLALTPRSVVKVILQMHKITNPIHHVGLFPKLLLVGCLFVLYVDLQAYTNIMNKICALEVSEMVRRNYVNYA